MAKCFNQSSKHQMCLTFLMEVGEKLRSNEGSILVPEEKPVSDFDTESRIADAYTPLICFLLDLTQIV